MTPSWDLFPASRVPFSAAMFQAPGKEYRATPLWSWNNKLTEPELLRQIDELKAMGFGGFHMHTRVGLDVEYLGPEFMRLVRACVDYAKEHDMYAWLYDEDRWPSGFAGGKITEDEANASFRCRHLLVTPWAYGDASHPGREGQPMSNSGEARRSELGRLLARYAIRLDEDGYLAGHRHLAEGDEDGVTDGEQLWYVYDETNAPSEWFNGSYYVDTLNPEAMRAFVAATHETYKRAVGDEFGRAVPAIFTDEPQFAMKKRLAHARGQADVFLPWTHDLAATYQARYGADLLAGLPEIVWDTRGAASATRYNFHDHVCERFTSAFTDQIAGWCADNGLGLTGHMMFEPELATQTGSVGEAMRCYRGMHLPGIDMLCDWREYTTAKQAQSVARQYGRCGVLSEIYGVTNWTFDFVGHKGSGDWQAALGVNVRCPHLAWYSMAGEAKRDYPAAIGYQSPWWRDYKAAVEDHFARVHYALTRGVPAVRVAVVHPIESFWLAYGPHDTSAAAVEMEKRFQDVTDWLCHGLVDFDFLAESLLLEQNVAARGGQLHVGHGHYDVVVVPALHTIRSTTLAALAALLADGGTVVVAGPPPALVDCVPTTKATDALAAAVHVPFSKTDILHALEDVRDVRATLTRSGLAADALLYQMRADGDDRYVFLCNTDRQHARDTQLDLRGDWDVRVLDTMTGDIRALANTTAVHRQGVPWTSFPFTFDGCGSVLLRLQPKTSASIPPSLTFSRPEWHVAGELALRKVSLSEPNVLLLDMARYRLDDEPAWSDHAEEILRTDNIARRRVGLPLRQDNLAQPYRVPPRTLPAAHTIHLRFVFEALLSQPVTDAQIALEGLDTATIVLDGQPVPSTKTGWWVDRLIETAALPPLVAGPHVLDISLPLDVRTNVERVYVLGTFGVDLRGRDATVVDLALDRVRIGDWTRQRLPFYAGDVTYEFAAVAGRRRTAVQVPRFAAPVLRVDVRTDGDGDNNATHSDAHIAFPPYRVDLGDVPPGRTVTVAITAVGNRNNAFGALHLPDGLTKWYGPDSFRTNGDKWTYEYVLQDMGLLAAPRLLTADKQLASPTWDAGSVDQDLWFH
ncbi:hypothetical protein HMPREF1624_05311 [Sporothrix schenckii ATCC 58251]|uniref:Glycoside hydrolase family 2 n=1 Tax=Sporothrix schenckii (strain ATCC 58251 / de Perez 2211183) TaxID=1391915 RepID=U7PSF6_SPOS1|nr:hypothetical protein HMPREF1624_05311 [Sporothrix schenckii ATCC 58251]